MVTLLLFIAIFIATIDGWNNGLAKTPPMGFSTWNYFKYDFNETTFYNIIDGFVNNGMKDVGYKYVNVDAGWWYEINNTIIRNSSGYLTYDPVRYPNGIESVINYAHKNGLKYGHYTDCGQYSCNKQGPMSEGYEQQDISLFVEWGIDMIKVDECSTVGNVTQIAFKWRDMLNKTVSGRDILFSDCHIGCVHDPTWSRYDNKTGQNNTDFFQPWCPSVANMWRISRDIKSNWASILHNIDCAKGIGKYAGPNAWNDPDMLEIGVGDFDDYGKSGDQIKVIQRMNEAHFSLWCIVSAPLIAGNDVVNMSDMIKNVLINKDAIDVNQNYLNHAGDLLINFNGITNEFKQEMIKQTEMNNNMTEIWYKPLPDIIGDAAILFLNRDNATSYNVSVNFNELPLFSNHDSNGMCNYFDIWSKEMKSGSNYNDQVLPQSVKFFRLQNCSQSF